MPPGPSPPRAPSTTSSVVGSSAHSLDAAAIRSAVRIAVPDGASILASWWSSMISTVSNHGAASSAKRIISTAPMAKLAAMRQELFVKAASMAAEVGVGEPGGADHGVQAVLGGEGEVLRAPRRRR